MFASQDGMPTPIATLDNLLEGGDASEKPYKVFIGHNLGNRTFSMLVPMHEFFSISDVANDASRVGDSIAQRKLDPGHAQKLAVYLLKGLVSAAIRRLAILKKPSMPALQKFEDVLGKQPYMSMQPIVVNIRNCDAGGANIRGERLEAKLTNETASFKVYFSQKHILWVIDGQHRRKAMELVFAFLDELRRGKPYPKKGIYPGEGSVPDDELRAWEECFDVARSYCSVNVEVHLGLTVDEERQLFHDLNNLGKKVESSLALNFDNSNPINLFIKERLIADLGMKVVEKDVPDWNQDDGSMSRKDLVAVNALLFLNKTNIGGATPPQVQPKEKVAYRFWETVSAVPGFGEPQAKEKTILAQPVVLKALAKLVYDFAFSARKPNDGDQLLERVLDSVTDIDFSHSNLMWRYYNLTPAQVKEAGLTGLADYLPSSEGNRDLGSVQGGFMRFGAKHNDIYPVLGDMIRWKLALPSRHADPEVAKSIGELLKAG